jgi:hypothetical protein
MLGDMSGKCVPGFADFARAAEIDLTTKDTGENDRRKVTHKTTQHVRAEGCRESQADLPAQKKTPFCRGLRPGARWCNPAEWRIGVPHLGRFPAGTGPLQGREGRNRGRSWQASRCSKPNWPG